MCEQQCDDRLTEPGRLRKTCSSEGTGIYKPLMDPVIDSVRVVATVAARVKLMYEELSRMNSRLRIDAAI